MAWKQWSTTAASILSSAIHSNDPSASLIVAFDEQAFNLHICLNRMLSASTNASYVSEKWHMNTNQAVHSIKGAEWKQG